MTTISCPIPADINPLSPNGFRFGIDKLPEVSFFCQSVNLPGVILGAPDFGNPLNVTPVPGESLTYDTLSVQFLIGEDMSNYKAIYNWIVGLAFPQEHEQYQRLVSAGTAPGSFIGSGSELRQMTSDGTLEILNSNNKPATTVAIYDMFPTSLDSLTFESRNSDVTYLIGNMSLRYSYYKFLD